MLGFFQENGPILWQPGVFEPKPNPYAWSGLTNMLWVEQPVGVGFTQGEVNTKGEFEVAKDFVGFFKNWEIIFGIENYKIYVTVSTILRSGVTDKRSDRKFPARESLTLVDMCRTSPPGCWMRRTRSISISPEPLHM